MGGKSPSLSHLVILLVCVNYKLILMGNQFSITLNKSIDTRIVILALNVLK